MRLPHLGALLLTAILAIAGIARADFPRPSVYPISWQLDFEHGLPTRIVVPNPGGQIPTAYWYITYSVTNNTDQEQSFLPQFDMVANDGRVIRSDQNIPQRAFDAIKAREGKPFLAPLAATEGAIRIGPAEAKDSVAIWREPLTRMGSFTIFVSGLSGEAVTMKNVDGHFVQVTDAADMKDTKKLTILRKTLQLDYVIHGDEVYPTEDMVNPNGEQWIMR